jgi:hypothetical protein
MHAGRTINCRRDHRPNRSLRPIVSLLRATAGGNFRRPSARRSCSRCR